MDKETIKTITTKLLTLPIVEKNSNVSKALQDISDDTHNAIQIIGLAAANFSHEDAKIYISTVLQHISDSRESMQIVVGLYMNTVLEGNTQDPRYTLAKIKLEEAQTPEDFLNACDLLISQAA